MKKSADALKLQTYDTIGLSNIISYMKDARIAIDGTKSTDVYSSTNSIHFPRESGKLSLAFILCFGFRYEPKGWHARFVQ